MIATQGHRQLTVSFMLSNKVTLYIKSLTSHVYEVFKLKYRTQLIRFETVDVQIEDAFVDAYLKVHYM